MDERVKKYWTQRARDFSAVRRVELDGDAALRWLAELRKLLPGGGPLDILDAGTGAGFFAILLAGEGHRVRGIDITPAMLDQARRLAAERGVQAEFLEMDAQAPDLPPGSFDAVVSRNLTWTLPDPEGAYRAWYRLLRPGGLLLNFDANYAHQIRRANRQNCSVPPDSPYGHLGLTPELERENKEITLSMGISQERRPIWDWAVLKEIGFSRVDYDTQLGRRVLGPLDVSDAPMFLVRAVK